MAIMDLTNELIASAERTDKNQLGVRTYGATDRFTRAQKVRDTELGTRSRASESDQNLMTRRHKLILANENCRIR